ncbi:MAG: D-amino-acid transaminase [Alphaproteobacteria bacterium]|nr:D-amino-acid transaminase [Alphaproteobacteria bacterium]
MSRVAYVNGRYVPHRQARVHIEDRGYQFADGVYEVIAVSGGALVDPGPHLDRLERSLRELRIAMPMTRAALSCVIGETIRRNDVVDGIIYIQMTRGAAPRDHAFPARAETQVVMTSRRSKPHPRAYDEDGVKAITVPDIRWARCDIKSISLLPNVLAKQSAREVGAYEAMFVAADGTVTEGSSTNAWIVTAAGELVTRAPTSEILSGITRSAVMDIAAEEGLRLVERPFSVTEAKAAREVFITSTTAFVMPVTQIDEAVIANGKSGSISRKLRARYAAHMAAAGASVDGASQRRTL